MPRLSRIFLPSSHPTNLKAQTKKLTKKIDQLERSQTQMETQFKEKVESQLALLTQISDDLRAKKAALDNSNVCGQLARYRSRRAEAKLQKVEHIRRLLDFSYANFNTSDIGVAPDPDEAQIPPYTVPIEQYTLVDGVWFNPQFEIVNKTAYQQICDEIKALNIRLSNVAGDFDQINLEINAIKQGVENFPAVFAPYILAQCELTERNLAEYKQALASIPRGYQQGASKVATLVNNKPIVKTHDKLGALALMNDFYFGATNESIPLFKLGQQGKSIREIAKSQGSVQGEVLDCDMFEKIASDANLATEEQRVSSYEQFRAALVANLTADKASFVAYTVDAQGQPAYFPDLTSVQRTSHEYLGIVTDYDASQDSFKVINNLTQGATTQYINGYQLFLANQSLASQNEPAKFTQIPDVTIRDQMNDQSGNTAKYVPASYIANNTLVGAQPNRGFKGVVIACDSKMNTRL